MATIDANGQTVWPNSPSYGYPLTGSGQLRIIDSAGGGIVVLGGINNDDGHVIQNAYTGGTTVLSGTLKVLYANDLPQTGVLTVGGPATVVLNAQAGTLFEGDAAGQATIVGDTGVDIVPSPPGADSAAPVSVLASGVGMAPLASNAAAVPEPSTLALLGAGLLGLLTLAWRRRTAT